MALLTKRLQRAEEDLQEAAALLRQGECVAFPTETVYGLGANAWDDQAILKIFTVKGRPGDNPLIIHGYKRDQVMNWVMQVPPAAHILMDHFWPGPLTLVLPKVPAISPLVTGGLDTVAVRIPDHPLAQKLLEMANIPIAAPSANVSGKPSPTRAEHVLEDLDGKIAAVVDGGTTGWGVESTVVDCTSYPFRLLRPGGITFEQLTNLVEITVDPGIYGKSQGTPRSPGMKYRHYSPNAEVIVVVGDEIQPTIARLIQERRAMSANTPSDGDVKIGVMVFSESKNSYPGVTTLEMGSRNEPIQVAAQLYHLLREADHLGLDLVFVEGLPEDDLGMAIMNRLRKAAGYHVITT